MAFVNILTLKEFFIDNEVLNCLIRNRRFSALQLSRFAQSDAVNF